MADAAFATVEARPKEDKRDSKVSAAVLQYIKALRALDQTRINTSMIAEALNLNHHDVLKAVKTLQAKGVKPL